MRIDRSSVFIFNFVGLLVPYTHQHPGTEPALPQLRADTPPGFVPTVPTHPVSQIASSLTFASSPPKRARPSPDQFIFESPTKRPYQKRPLFPITPLGPFRAHLPAPTIPGPNLAQRISETFAEITNVEDATAHVRITVLNAVHKTLQDLCKDPKYQEAAAEFAPKIRTAFLVGTTSQNTRPRESDQPAPQDKSGKAAISPTTYATVTAQGVQDDDKRQRQAPKAAPKTVRQKTASTRKTAEQTRTSHHERPDTRIFIRLPPGNTVRNDHPASLRLRITNICALQSEDITQARWVQSGLALTTASDNARQAILSCRDALCTTLNATGVEGSQSWASYSISFVPNQLSSGVDGNPVDISQLIETEVKIRTGQKPIRCNKAPVPVNNQHPNESRWVIHLAEKVNKPFRLFETSSIARLIERKPKHARCTRCMDWHRPETCHKTPTCADCGHNAHPNQPCELEQRCPVCHEKGPTDHKDCRLAPKWDGNKFIQPTRSLRLRLRARNGNNTTPEVKEKVCPRTEVMELDDQLNLENEDALDALTTIEIPDDISETDPTDPGPVDIPSSPAYRAPPSKGKNTGARPSTRAQTKK
jgi:hypothetical protein